MKVGCFALIEPFSSLDHQLQIIEDMGFKYADVTDSHSGGSLIDTIGMTASVSLDSNPIALKRLFEKHGITATTVCAHAKLLDPSNPSKYGVNEIWKRMREAVEKEKMLGEEAWIYGCELCKTLSSVEFENTPVGNEKKKLFNKWLNSLVFDLKRLKPPAREHAWVNHVARFYGVH